MNTKNNDATARLEKLELNMATQHVEAWFAEAEATLHRQIDELRRYRDRANEVSLGVVTGDKRTVSAAHVMSWAVNSVANIQGNLRLDLAVIAGVRLDRAIERVETAIKDDARTS